jgi:thioredoxin 1
MKMRYIFAVAAATTAIAAANLAAAAEFRPFTSKEFAAAQAAGRPIVVDVFAPWCPTCRAQEPALRQLGGEPKFDKLVVFRLDFDSQKPAWRALKVWRQSTLIAFKGRRETARSVADTDPAAIEQLFATTVQ